MTLRPVLPALLFLLPCIAATPDVDKAKVMGGITAPVTIEVFSSFACSHCKDFHDRVLPQIVKDYVVQGKVCIIGRECFPPNFAPALEAATIATAAARIGKYQEVADALFKSQASWIVDGKIWAAAATALNPAQQQRVQALLKDPTVAAEVQRDQDRAKTLGVTQTPTLYITRGAKSYPYTGVPEYSLFKGLLETLLAQK